MFLSIIAHNKKNRVIHFDFIQSGETISKYFHAVLNAILRLHKDLLVRSKPISHDYGTERWQPFQGCLGALDGTHVRVRVRKEDQIPYRGRNGIVTVNVLAACDPDMLFTYVLSGWEGSSADSRVLSNALARRNGLRVPEGQYYLCDNGYTNGQGFLTPYTQTRYHLKAWGYGMEAPQNPQEYFIMVHSKARNVIEKAFGLLKIWWKILDEESKYPVKVQNKVILACCLLQNFIRLHMPKDPLEEEELDEDEDLPMNDDHPGDYVQVLRSSPEWTAMRDDLAVDLYNNWAAARGGVA